MPESLRCLGKGGQQRGGGVLPAHDVVQTAQPLVGTPDEADRGGLLLLGVPVAPPCRLHNAVHSGREADHPLKGDVHAGLDHLRGDADDPLPAGGGLVQRGLQGLQSLPAVLDAHGGGQVEAPTVLGLQRLEQERRLLFRVAHHQQTAARRQCLRNDLRELLQPGASGVLDVGAPEDVPRCLLLRNQIDGLAMQRVVGCLQTGLGGRAQNNSSAADLGQEVDRQIEQRQHFAGNGLYLVDHDDAAAQRVKSADGAGPSAEAGIQELHQRGDNDRRRPGGGEQLQRLQALRRLLRLGKVGVMLQYQSVVPYVIADDLGILIQDRQQRCGEDNSRAVPLCRVGQCEAETGQRFSAAGGDVQAVDPSGPGGAGGTGVRNGPPGQINGVFSGKFRKTLFHERQPFCPDWPHILWEHGRFYPIHKSGGVRAIPLDHGGQEHPSQKTDIKCGLPIRLIVIRLGGQGRQPIQHGGHFPDGVAEQMLQLLLVSNLRQKALSGFIVKDPLLGLAMKKTAVLLGVDAVKQAVV